MALVWFHNFGELKPTKHKEIVGRDGIPAATTRVLVGDA
jgi:hypothetical protein